MVSFAHSPQRSNVDEVDASLAIHKHDIDWCNFTML